MSQGSFWRRALILTALAAQQVAALVSPARAQIAAPPAFATGDGDYDPAELAGLALVPLTRTFSPEAVSLKDRFPKPGNQKDLGACVAWSVGYAARSYYEIATTGSAVDDMSRIVSPAALHAQLLAAGGTCEAPQTNIYRGLQELHSRGAPSILRHPASYPDGFCGRTDRASASFRIRDVKLVGRPLPRFGSGKRQSGLSPDSLDRMRLELAAGHPVLIGMLVGKSFMGWPAGSVYSGSIHQRHGDYLPEQAGHAMVIVGYDDSRRAFQIMNSWGEGWGEGGFIWIDYDTMLSDARQGFVMRTDVDPPRPSQGQSGAPRVQLSGLEAEHLACASITVEGGAAKGYVATEAARLAVQQLASTKGLNSEVVLRPWPVCEVLQTLRAPLAAARRPRVTLVGGDRTLRVGEAFAIQVTPPTVRSYVYVIYIEDDGTVVNLLPKRGVLRAQVDIDSPPLIFGDGVGGRPRFRVTPLRSVDAHGRARAPGDPERGHEAIIVIAAQAPIEELEDGSPVYAKAVAAGVASDAGPPDRLLLSKLRDITTRVAQGAEKPREVAADVLHLRIVD